MKHINTMSTALKIFIFALMTGFVFYDMLVQISPGTITHQLMADLNINATSVGILSGIYFYTYLSMQIPAGLLLDRFPVRYVALPLFLTAIAIAFFSTLYSFSLVILARLLMGIGTAFAFISVARVVVDIFKPNIFPIFVGFSYFIAAMGALFAQVPLTFLIHYVGVERALQIIALIGIILSITIWMTVRYKVSSKPQQSASSEHIFRHLKAVLRKPKNWICAIVSCCTWAPMVIFASLWSIPFLMQTFHISKSVAASEASYLWIGLGISSLVMGFISHKYKQYTTTIILGSLLGSVSFFFILFDASLSLMELSVLLFFIGTACATQPLTYSFIKENNEKEHAATSIAFNNMAAIFSGALFQPLTGYLMAHYSLLGKVNYRAGLMVVIACFFVSIIACVILKFTRSTHGISLLPSKRGIKQKALG